MFYVLCFMFNCKFVFVCLCKQQNPEVLPIKYIPYYNNMFSSILFSLYTKWLTCLKLTMLNFIEMHSIVPSSTIFISCISILFAKNLHPNFIMKINLYKNKCSNLRGNKRTNQWFDTEIMEFMHFCHKLKILSYSNFNE